MSDVTIVKNATCTFCGCVCDDIELHAQDNKIIKAKMACSLGEAHFKYHTAEHHYPDALIDGKEATDGVISHEKKAGRFVEFLVRLAFIPIGQGAGQPGTTVASRLSPKSTRFPNFYTRRCNCVPLKA